PPSHKYSGSRSARREKEGHDFEAALSLFFPVGLIAERAGLPFALSSSISPPPPTADARVSARSKPDCGGDVPGDRSRIRPRADRSLQPAFRQRIYPAAAREQAPVRVRVRQPGHGPGSSVAKRSRTHSFTALVNHTAQGPPPRQSALVVRCRPRNSSPATRLRLWRAATVSATERTRRHGRVQRWAGKGNTARPEGPSNRARQSPPSSLVQCRNPAATQPTIFPKTHNRQSGIKITPHASRPCVRSPMPTMSLKIFGRVT